MPVWMGMFAVFVNSFGTMAMLFLSLYFVSELGFSVTEASELISLYNVGAVFGAYLSGRLCEKYSSKTVSICSLILNSIALISILLYKDFYSLLCVTSVMGAANSSFVPANRIWLMKQCEEDQRARVNSLRFMMANLGMGIAVVIGGILAKSSYQILFMFNGTAFLISAIILSLLKTSNGVLNEMTNNSSALRAEKQQLLTIPPFFENKGFFLIYLLLLLATLTFSQLWVNYPIYMRNEYQLDEQAFSNLFLINTVLIVLFQVVIVDLASRYSLFLSAAVGAFLVGFGMYLLILGSSYFLTIISCFIWTVGEILTFPILQTLLYNRAKDDNKATHMGLYQTVYAWLYPKYRGTLIRL
ncbi:MFS transporter [Legionella sp.]|uniref:MFS transporter n=1 Tax=Legionella sp. TaxID=459 RepID=UPI003CB6B1C5